MSTQSRNRHVGEELGRGRRLDEIVAAMNMVAEGIKTTKAVVDLAAKVGVEMPIAAQVNDVLDGAKTAAEVIPLLMQREAKPELQGIEG
jgi:glycerol-3-phosphate dehydrogenase (NAD(P)+)